MKEAHPAAGRERVLTVQDFCGRYKLSRGTVYKLMGSGILRSVKIGGRRLIPVEEAERLIAQHLDGSAR